MVIAGDASDSPTLTAMAARSAAIDSTLIATFTIGTASSSWRAPILAASLTSSAGACENRLWMAMLPSPTMAAWQLWLSADE